MNGTGDKNKAPMHSEMRPQIAEMIAKQVCIVRLVVVYECEGLKNTFWTNALNWEMLFGRTTVQKSLLRLHQDVI